jgi:hypothetical protein
MFLVFVLLTRDDMLGKKPRSLTMRSGELDGCVTTSMIGPQPLHILPALFSILGVSVLVVDGDDDERLQYAALDERRRPL